MKLEKPCRDWHRGLFSHGYGQRRFQGRNMGAHRAAWIEAYGPIPAGMFVCHLCDRKICIELSHLYLGTHADNTRDAVERWRVPRGKRNGMSKLTDEQVREIRRRCNGGEACASVAKDYGISVSLASRITLGKARRIVGRKSYTPPPPDRTRQVHAELIRILYECGYEQRPLGVMFGLSQSHISRIVNGEGRKVRAW